MSLEARLIALAEAIGADINDLRNLFEAGIVGGSALGYILIKESMNWVSPINATVEIIAVGGGSRLNNTSNYDAAGGTVIKTGFVLKKGDTLQVTIGAPSSTGSVAGGTTSVTGPMLDISATGGMDFPATPGVGIGGDYNLKGGWGITGYPNFDYTVPDPGEINSARYFDTSDDLSGVFLPVSVPNVGGAFSTIGMAGRSGGVIIKVWG